MLSIKSGYDLFCPNNLCTNFDHWLEKSETSNNVFRLDEDTSVFNEQVERWLIFLWFIEAIKKHTLFFFRILGFKNINDALLKGVRQSYKTDLKSLVELTCVDHANSTSYHEGKTVYICSAEPPGGLNLVCTG